MKRNNINPAYEKYQDDLLLHSMSNYIFQIREILKKIKPKSIAEIGIEGGKFSKYLLEYAKANNIEYIGVEPQPSSDVKTLIQNDYNQTLIESTSLDNRAQKVFLSDVIFIDGDHNYYTVINELKNIYKNNPDAIVFLHDVGWPWARRDLYYNVMGIKEEHKKKFTFEGGLVPGQDKPQKIGFSGNGEYAFAIEEGGEKNGVLTAIEDFLDENPEFSYMELLSIFGLGIIYRKKSLAEEEKAFFEFFQKSLDLWNPLFVNLEENRITLLIELWKQHEVIKEQNAVIDNFLMSKIKKLIKKAILK